MKRIENLPRTGFEYPFMRDLGHAPFISQTKEFEPLLDRFCDANVYDTYNLLGFHSVICADKVATNWSVLVGNLRHNHLHFGNLLDHHHDHHDLYVGKPLHDLPVGNLLDHHHDLKLQ